MPGQRAGDQRTQTVWFVSELYYPEETSTGYYITGIAEGLATTFKVKVLCSQPTYRARGLRVPPHEHHRGVEIWRCRGTTLDKNNLLLRAINMLTITLAILVLAVRLLRRGDSVVVTTNPPSLPYVVRAACALRGSACVLLVHDVYPQALIATGVIRPDGLAARVLSKLQQALVTSMSRVIVIGRDMHQLIAMRAPAASSRIALIPNWADVDRITPTDRKANVLLQELGIGGRFVVQYSGNIGRTHGIEELVEAATRLRGQPLHFLFIGDGAMRPYLDAEIRRRDLDNVTRLPARPREELAASLNACDVAIISLARGMVGVSVPSRTYNVLAAGKPIVAVADHDSELARVVEEENVGWVVDPGDVDGLVRLLQAISVNTKLSEMSGRARQVVERKYSRVSVLQAYMTLISDLRRDAPSPSRTGPMSP